MEWLILDVFYLMDYMPANIWFMYELWPFFYDMK